MEKQESKVRFPTFPQPPRLRTITSYAIRILRARSYIRSVVGEGPGAFKCVPVRGPELQAVYLRACAAGLKKCSVKFCRPGTDASYQPEELNWRMRPDTQSGQLVWNVDRLGRALHSEELAQAILEQLNEYCTDYERELQSFYD
jgi:hypothetical protein